MLVARLERVHMLLLLMTTVDRFTYGSTYGTAHVLTTMIVAEHVPRAYTVRNQALLVLALGNMLPETLHSSTVRGHWTLSVFVLALGGMSQEK